MSKDEEALRCEAVERCLSSRCKGLIECRRWQPRDAYSYGEGEIEQLVAYEVHFLHRTVRDFLSTPTIQVKLVASDTSQFNGNMTLAKAFVAQIKALRYASHTETNFEALWNLVLDALHYMSQVKEGVSAEAQRALLEELDRAAAVFRGNGIFKRGCDKDSHWMNTGYRFGFLVAWNNDLMTLAVHFNLISSVKQLLLHQTSLDRVGKPLLAFALMLPPATLSTVYTSVNSAFKNYTEELYTAPQVEMVKLLLHYGADPNTMDGEKTVWVRYLESVYEWATRSDPKFETQKGRWFETTKLLVQHGALPVTLNITIRKRDNEKHLNLPGGPESQGMNFLSAQNVIRIVFGDSGYDAEELEDLLDHQVPKPASRQSRRHISDSYLQTGTPSSLKHSTSLHTTLSHGRDDRSVFPSSSFSHQSNAGSKSSLGKANNKEDNSTSLLSPHNPSRTPSFGKMIGKVFGRFKSPKT